MSEDGKPGGWSDGLIGVSAGCIVFPLVLVALAVLSFVVFPPEVGIGRRAFPAGVDLGAAVHHEAQSGGLEGCHLVVFRLAAADVQRMQNDASAYLGSLASTTQRGQALSAWRETPRMYRGTRADAEGWGCRNGRRSQYVFNAARAVDGPGSYYATFAHEEGRLYLIPSLGLAVYYYWG